MCGLEESIPATTHDNGFQVTTALDKKRQRGGNSRPPTIDIIDQHRTHIGRPTASIVLS